MELIPPWAYLRFLIDLEHWVRGLFKKPQPDTSPVATAHSEAWAFGADAVALVDPDAYGTICGTFSDAIGVGAEARGVGANASSFFTGK
jgi:hypothetical protein